MPRKYDPETRAKAVRLVLDHRGDYPSRWAAIKAVSRRLGMNPETLRNWIREHKVDAGQRDGVSSEAAAELRELKRKNAELEQTIEILKAVTTDPTGRFAARLDLFGGAPVRECGHPGVLGVATAFYPGSTADWGMTAFDLLPPANAEQEGTGPIARRVSRMRRDLA